jgi:hypothetical protein
MNEKDLCKFYDPNNTIYHVNISFFAKKFRENVYSLRYPMGFISNLFFLLKRGKIHSVDYSNSAIEDVSGFKKIPTVILRNCKKLVNVAPLCDCETVILQGCENVTDISSLCNIHTLDIRGTGITNVSELKGVKNLIK